MKRKTLPTLTDQLRDIIDDSGMSRYRLAKESGVDAGQLCRFMQGSTQLTTEKLDRIAAVLKLRLSVESTNPPTERRTSKRRTPRNK